jgi:lysophospholipase L1-like esterase
MNVKVLNTPSVNAPTTKPLKLVAVGDSLTAGMQDMNLIGSRQESSYPNLLAKSLGVPFTQPTLSNQGIPPRFFLSPGSSILRSAWRYAQVGLAGAPAMGALALGFVPPDWSLWPMCQVGGMGKPQAKESFQNLAVPGFELRHINSVRRPHQVMEEMADGAQSIGSLVALGPYSKYILQQGDKVGKTEIEHAIDQKPDITVFWGGNNDVLSAAQSGEINDMRLTPMEDRVWDLDNGETTSGVMPGLRSSLVGPDGALTQLLANTTSEIAVMNIPDVTVIPSLIKLGEPVGKLPFCIKLPNGTDVTKKIENWVVPSGIVGEGKDGRTEFPEGSRVSLMTMLTKFTHYFKVDTTESVDYALDSMNQNQAAFREDEVTDPDECDSIQARADEFNQLIAETVEQNPRLHLVDTNQVLRQAATKGIQLRGEGADVTVTNTFTGQTDDRGFSGMFSFDGIHPSDVGYAVIANRVLDKLQTDLGDKPGFESLMQATPVDEKAVLAQDPHNGERPTLVLNGFALDQMMASNH